MKGRTTLVLGGAGYLGSQSQGIAQIGGDLIIASRDLAKCELLSTKLHCDYNINALAFKCDISEIGSVSDARDIFGDAFSSIDSLVLCAWNGKKNSLDSISSEDWDHDVDVCLSSCFKTVQALKQPIIDSKGSILFIGSMYGHIAPDPSLYDGTDFTNPPSYGAAKAGIEQLTRYLASFLGQYSVNVNCIAPGPFPFKTPDQNLFLLRGSKLRLV